MIHRSLTWQFIREIVARLLLLAIFPFFPLLIASWIFPQLNLPFIKWIFSIIIVDPIDGWGNSFSSYEADKFDEVAVYIGIMGIVSALLTFFLSATLARLNQRKQSTLQILVESRFSPSFQELIEKVNGQNDPEEWDIFTILNYYEFLAAGVIQRNLDEAILKKTVRGFLCRATYKWGDKIYNIRVTEDREASYENLVAVYWRWLDKSRDDERGESATPRLGLGSKPHQWVSWSHKILHSKWQILVSAGFGTVYIMLAIIC